DNNSQTHYAKGKQSLRPFECPFKWAFQISNLKSIWRQPNGRSSYTLYVSGCRYYFTPLAGVLFTFPSRYLFTIGCQGVFSLIRWSGQIHAEFHVHRVTWDTPRGCSDFRA